MVRRFALTAALGAALAMAGAAPSVADANVLILLQESPAGSATGNTLVIDQSPASASLIAGAVPLGGAVQSADPAPVSDPPALQRGEGHVAGLTIAGLGGTALLTQQGAGGAFGFDNSATIEVTGTDALGVIEQSGNGNTGTVRVSGDLASGTLIQRGNGNTMALEVTGHGASVVHEQIGNNMTADVPVQVFTNTGGTIQITQTRF